MNKATALEPRNLSAAVRTRLDEIESWLDKGVSRQEIALLLNAEYSFSVTPKALEMALYRARLKRKKGGLHNPNVDSGLRNPDPVSDAGQVDSGLHNPDEENLVEDMGGNKEFLSHSDFKKIGDEAKKVASSFKGRVGNKKGF
ncbi:hypothetical protein ACLEDK_16845 [Lonsdalea quercina]|uniref:hypothetical protein n=1 Tax=Lonsdalea quercina TaxID=71657 RepID=UPI003974A8BE